MQKPPDLIGRGVLHGLLHSIIFEDSTRQWHICQ
jgi:hypothetical protein